MVRGFPPSPWSGWDRPGIGQRKGGPLVSRVVQGDPWTQPWRAVEMSTSDFRFADGQMGRELVLAGGKASGLLSQASVSLAAQWESQVQCLGFMTPLPFLAELNPS